MLLRCFRNERYSAIDELAVCWSNASRKIFQHNHRESVKLFQYFCCCLDFKTYPIDDFARYRFFIDISSKLPYLSFFTIVLKSNIVQSVSCASSFKFVDTVHKRFKLCAVDAHCWIFLLSFLFVVALFFRCE